MRGAEGFLDFLLLLLVHIVLYSGLVEESITVRCRGPSHTHTVFCNSADGRSRQDDLQRG